MPSTRPTIAIVLAAGSGTRMGAGVPKQLLTLAGQSVLARTLTAFEAATEVESIVVVTAGPLRPTVAEIVADGPWRKVTTIVTGGATRADSVRAALAVLAEAGTAEADVLIHDAARPLVDPAVIDACAVMLHDHRAAVVALASTDTLLQVADGRVTDVPDRSTLWRAQTPQGFRLSVIAAAHVAAAASQEPVTDDASVVLRHRPDVTIHVVPGNERNLKVTTPADLVLAAALLQS